MFAAAILATACAAAAEVPADAGIDSASHVVIGTVKDVAVVSYYNNLLYRLNPQPNHLASYTAAQLQIEVQEVLYPAGWKPQGAIKYLFGDALYPVAQIRHDTLEKPMIYVLQAQTDGKILDRSPIFYAAGRSGTLGLPLRDRAAVEHLLAQRRARERAAAGN